MWTTFKNYFKKMVNVDLDTVPQKSLAATVIVELGVFSKSIHIYIYIYIYIFFFFALKD